MRWSPSWVAASCLLALAACSGGESDEVASAPDASTGGGGGTGGNSIADASFGGGSGNSGGSAGTGGAGTGGAVGGTTGSGGQAGSGGAPQDAATEAPFVCDSTGALDCSASQAASYSCGDPSPNLSGAVNAAVKLVLAQHPEYFDTSQGFPCCPLAVEPVKFVADVVAAINAGGECAQIDPNNPSIEIVVKHNNKCSEQYVLLTSANIVRNPAKFQGSCAPAWL